MSFQYTDNQLAILLMLYTKEDPISRYALAKELSMSRQSISYNIKKLIELGIIEESGSGIQLKGIFFHPEVKPLFQEIINKVSDYIAAEEIISAGTSHDMTSIMECIFMIILTLSKRNNTSK